MNHLLFIETAYAHPLIVSEVTALDRLHLGATHLLLGIDHVLFLVALVLAYVSFKHTLKLVSLFTIGYSTTFIVAGLGFVTLPSQIVEPLIALSIALVAFFTVFQKQSLVTRSIHTGWTIFLIGLIHGFGFVGSQDEETLGGLVLLAIGLYIGQMLVLLCIVPIISELYGKKHFSVLQHAASALLTLLGIFWCIERLFIV